MRIFLAVIFLISVVSADVLTVDPSGNGDYLEVQAAIDGASEEDLVLVRGFNPAEVLILGKSVTLIGAEPGVSLGRVRVENLASDQTVILASVKIFGSTAPEVPPMDLGKALVVQDCLGPVRVIDCELLGSSGGLPITESAEGALIRGGSNFSVLSSRVRGGISDPALTAESSNIASFESEFLGGLSTWCWPGGPGMRLQGGATLLDSESRLVGSSGEPFGCGSCGADGGSALVASAMNSATLCSTSLEPAAGGFGQYEYYYEVFPCGGANGLPVSGTLVPDILNPAVKRRASFAHRVIEGAYLTVDLEGAVGDEAVLVLSTSSEFLPALSGVGVQLAGMMSPGDVPDRVIALGTLPTSRWSVPVPIPVEGSSFKNQTWLAQVVFVDSLDEVWYGAGSFLSIENDEGLDSESYFCFAGEANGSSCGVCPCSNSISPGNWGGCRNGNGTSCRLFKSGEASLTGDTLSFSVTGAGTDTAALLNSADNRLPAMGACPIGSGIGMGSGMDGLRCIGGALLRHGVRGVDVNGNSINPWGFGSPNPPGGILANAGFSVGQTRHFQVFYRDNFQTGCQTALNTSNGVSVTVEP